MAESPSNNDSARDGALTEEELQNTFSLLKIDCSEAHSIHDKSALLLGKIMELNDLFAIYEVMDLLNISSDGATTIEETKERINIRLKPAQSATHVEITRLIDVQAKFDKCKDMLDTLYTEYIEILNTTFPSMKDRLASEDIISNVSRNIQETQESLKNVQCTIIVTGETGAGKSTLLNLILNDMVLPHHAISCTSTICIIKYGEKKHMKVFYCSGELNEFDIKDDEESRAKLKDAMFKRSGREMGSDIRLVELQLPSDILKCGLVLVDTPGIGENEAMEETLTKFIAENQIQGFMYVIKVDGAACGIQEDRILKLMKIVLEKQNSSVSNQTETCYYDTATTFFIFNRWDLVPEDERTNVRDYVVKRLKKCSPNLNESEILFMSAKSVIRQLENGFISKSYIELIKRIREMMEKSTYILLKRFYRWLNFMVSRSLHHCKTLFSGADFSEYQQKLKSQEIEEKMNNLESTSASIFQDFRDDINTQEESMNEYLSECLQSEILQKQISSFSETEMEFVMNAPNSDELICEIIGDKIIDTISADTTIDLEINMFKKMLMKSIKKRTFFLQEDLSIIEEEMNSDIINPIDRYTSRHRCSSNISVSSFRLPVAPPKIPSSVMGRLAISMKKVLRIKNSKQFRDTKTNIQKLCNEEISYFLNENKYVSSQLEPIRHYLELAEKSIPKLIESNKTLIVELAENHTKHKIEKEMYIAGLNKILLLQDKIARFGYENSYNQKRRIEKSIDINVLDSVLSCDNSVIDSGIVVDTNTRVPQSLFTEIIPAFSCDLEITIRKYFDHVDIPSVYTEIEKLICLHHESVARFLQSLPSDRSIPNILFEERLFSLRNRTNHLRQRAMVTLDDYPVFVKNIVSGLVYLHSNGLTHPEVSLDSVMINWHKQVKLIGMALPRKIKILDMEQPIQDMIYLAPEVLRGKVYESPADVFGLGLLICELYIKKKVFIKESMLHISDFIRSVDTSIIEYFELVPPTYKELVIKMLEKQPNERITSNRIWNVLKS